MDSSTNANLIITSPLRLEAAMSSPPPEADDKFIPSTLATFDFLDYCVFCIMLALSALIGVYFAFFAKQRQNTVSEFLMGGKKMGILPVSLSLIASYISGITLLGMPAEVYVYGTQYWSVLIAIFLASTSCGIFFLPVFYTLQLNTSYEYLQVRFDRRVRLLGSFLYTLSTMLYIPIVIYVPALAFNQVTGVNLHLVTPLVCLVCIFYTSLGGIKAVVWTDALQTVLMFGGMIVVIVVGTVAVGGFDVVWKRGDLSGRIELFNLSLDPTVRHTFWNVSFASFFGWVTHTSVNQDMVQRFLTQPTIYKAQIMLCIFCLGVMALVSLSCYAGLLIFATYHDCDRITAKFVRASDQLLPYFVMDVVGFVPGLPGLFMAGVFSAALSSMSTGLNSMAGVIFEDFIRPRWNNGNVSDAKASFTMKIICAVMGVICVAMVFAIENLGGVLQVSASLGGATTGPMLGIFSLGIFFPWANSLGAFVGGISGLIVMSWISFGTQAAIAAKQITFPKKPVSMDGCAHLLQVLNSSTTSPTSPTMPLDELEEPLPIYRVSYLLYPLIGVTVVLTMGVLVSFLTGSQNLDELNPDHLTPPVRHLFLKARRRRGQNRRPALDENAQIGQIEMSKVIEPLLKARK